MNDKDTLREYLAAKLFQMRPAMLTAEEYYTGTQPMGYLDPEVVKVMGGRIRPLSVNLARLAVDALAQRLTVTGFRSSPGEVVDRQLLDVWQANNLDEQSQLAQVDALIHGRSYFMCWAGADGGPLITAESPLQLVVMRDPVTMMITAALKRWLDPDGRARSLLMTPDTITEYASRGKSATLDPMYGLQPEAAAFVIDDSQMVREDGNPLGVVPVVALVNRPRLQYPDGESDLTDLMPLIQAIGKMGSDLMVAGEYAASPRRWVTGLVPPGLAASTEQMNDIKAKVKQDWESAHASKFLIASSEGTKFGSFDVADLQNYATAIELLTGQVAALASLPPYYVQGNTANPTSADAIRSSESRLTAKARQRQAWWSGSYESLMRMAVLVRDGQADGRLADLQTLWEDPEPSTVAQTADAESKLLAAGITDRRAALESLGYTPLDIERMLSASTAVIA